MEGARNGGEERKGQSKRKKKGETFSHSLLKNITYKKAEENMK